MSSVIPLVVCNCVAVLLLAVLYCVYRHVRAKRRRVWDRSHKDHHLHSVRQTAKSNFNVDFKDLEFQESVGSGSQGVVYAAIYKGTKVAVKKINTQTVAPERLAALTQEIEIMRALIHPCLTMLIGVSHEKPHLCVVTEFVDRGSLFDVIHNKSGQFSWHKGLQVAYDVARGVSFLHAQNPPVLHRDLKSLNILVTSKWRGKVADFGMTRILSEGVMTQCGSPLWMAPEVVVDEAYDCAADVYAFGVVLWELYTRVVPYSDYDIPTTKVVQSVVEDGLRPDIPPQCPARYAQLIADCWAQNPVHRPNMDAVLRRLTACLRDPEVVCHDPRSGVTRFDPTLMQLLEPMVGESGETDPVGAAGEGSSGDEKESQEPENPVSWEEDTSWHIRDWHQVRLFVDEELRGRRSLNSIRRKYVTGADSFVLEAKSPHSTPESSPEDESHDEVATTTTTTTANTTVAGIRDDWTGTKKGTAVQFTQFGMHGESKHQLRVGEYRGVRVLVKTASLEPIFRWFDRVARFLIERGTREERRDKRESSKLLLFADNAHDEHVGAEESPHRNTNTEKAVSSHPRPRRLEDRAYDFKPTLRRAGTDTFRDGEGHRTNKDHYGTPPAGAGRRDRDSLSWEEEDYQSPPSEVLQRRLEDRYNLHDPKERARSGKTRSNHDNLVRKISQAQSDASGARAFAMIPRAYTPAPAEEGELTDAMSPSLSTMALLYPPLKSDSRVSNPYLKGVRRAVLKRIWGVFRRMASLRHPNLVLFMGAYHDKEQKQVGMVQEMIQYGSLNTLLRSDKFMVGWGVRVNMLVDAAAGMTHLHLQTGKPTTHEDLHTGRLLVTRNWRVKVGGYGFVALPSVITDAHMNPSTWTAPEVILNPSSISPASNVYSFGLIICHVMTGRLPFKRWDLSDKLKTQIVRGLRPKVRNMAVGPALQALITACLHPDPSQRPLMMEVLQALQMIKKKGPPRVRLTLQSARLYRNSGTVFAYKSTDPIIIKKQWGLSQAPPGGWVLVQDENDAFCTSDEQFHREYSGVAGGYEHEYHQKDTVLARQMPHAFAVRTQDGSIEQGQKDDYLVQSGSGDQWVVLGDNFVRLFEPV